MNLYRIDRNVYGVLDWIGDLGGFFEGLLVLGLLLNSWYSFSFENYMIEHLFVKRDKVEKKTDSKESCDEKDSDDDGDDKNET